ncbi:MAG: transglycosylase, partial [Pseudomonadota bacterium]
MPLVPVSFDALAGWPDDDHDAALAAFRASASRLIEGQYRERELSPATADMSRVAKTAIEVRDARRFFEECFTPMRAPEQGFLTGFFEPVVRGSRIRTPEFA